MRKALQAILVTTMLVAASSANARMSTTVGSLSTRHCHCDRYTNPHYSRYVPRTGPYRGGISTRY